MNIVICLRGMHYLQDNNKPIDYEYCLSNHYEYMIKPLLDMGHNLVIIACTYDSSKLQKMLKDYNINHYIALPDNIRLNGGTWLRQLAFHKQSIELIKNIENEQNIKFDQIINMRFEMYFNMKITEFPIHYDKFNLRQRNIGEEPGNYNGCDNFFLFNRRLLDRFEYAINNLLLRRGITHSIINYFKDEDINAFIYGITSTENWEKYLCIKYVKDFLL
jgi:hypothetical protein